MSPTKTLLDVLRGHYIKPGAGDLPGGVFIPECGINGRTGSRADALYVGFTSASGRLLVGHELKVSRSDWRKELDTAGKADFWADNCHAWYIVAPGPEIVPAEEVPHGWGLMYPSTRSKTRMQTIVKPKIHADRTPSWEAVRSIMSRLDTLRAQHDIETRRNAREQARQDAEEQIQQRVAAISGTKLTTEQRDRLEGLARLEELLGVTIDRWAWDKPDAVKPEVAAAALTLAQRADQLLLHHHSHATEAFERIITRMQDGLSAYEEARSTLLALIGEPA